MKKFLQSVMTLVIAIAMVSCGGNSNKDGRDAQELSGAGATFPYGKDPSDSNIRIAPTFPTPEVLSKAVKVLTTSVKLACLEKLCK